MRRRRIWGGIGSVAFLFAILAIGLGPSRSPALPPPPGPAPAPSFRGAGSCSATACHGGPGPAEGKALRNEHTTWIRRDRHADAFAVLLGERSRSIAANLSGGQIPADKDARCLACHSTPRREPADARAQLLVREGVGCESCHGPADRWIGPHTRFDWATRPALEKERLGMAETADIGRRAVLCAGCHVGEPARGDLPARDDDHEMLAAGHPRLNFEFSAYLATMPHHWRDDVGTDSAAGFPAKAWAIGQLATARAAVDLTADRAARSSPGPRTPAARVAEWPELSEYACFSCHHGLRDDAWRRGPAGAPGKPRWNPWQLAMLPDFGPTADALALGDGVQKFRRLMADPRPNPAEVGRLASIVSGLLDRRQKEAERHQFDAAELEVLLAGVLASRSRGEPPSWELDTQRYLALVPLNQSARSLNPGRADARSLEELAKLRDFLRFPEGSDSPKSFDPARAPVGLRPF